MEVAGVTGLRLERLGVPQNCTGTSCGATASLRMDRFRLNRPTSGKSREVGKGWVLHGLVVGTEVWRLLCRAEITGLGASI